MNVTEEMLTEEQKDCINYPSNKNLLVRGVAGSGKSLVIVNRAILFARKARAKGKPAKIVIYTFVNTLVDYMMEVIERGEDVSDDITVKTLDSEIVGLYRNVIGGKLKGLYDSRQKELDAVADEFNKKYPKNRFFKKEMRQFLMDELAWMKQHMIKTMKDYEDTPRKGRGSVRISKKNKQLIFETYQKFYISLVLHNEANFDAICEELYEAREKIPVERKYDLVLIDEAQDLPLNKLLIARELAGIALTIAADFAQKIYRTGFTWKEVGIDIRGQASKKLHGTHRNTRQIALLANSLLSHNSELAKMDEDEYVPPELPEEQGPEPVLVYEQSYAQEREDVVSLINKILQKQPDFTVAVLGRDFDAVKKIKTWLNKEFIPYQEIKKNNDYKILEPGVKVVTYHSAKGLEFDHVILPFLDDGIFPYKHDDREEAIDEETNEDIMNRERNLLYVGMTRARSMLYMFACDGSEADPSPFINEMDEELMTIKR